MLDCRDEGPTKIMRSYIVPGLVFLNRTCLNPYGHKTILFHQASEFEPRRR